VGELELVKVEKVGQSSLGLIVLVSWRLVGHQKEFVIEQVLPPE